MNNDVDMYRIKGKEAQKMKKAALDIVSVFEKHELPKEEALAILYWLQSIMRNSFGIECAGLAFENKEEK